MPAQHLAKLHLVKNPREYGYLTKVTGERRGRGTEGKGEEEEEGEGGRREGGGRGRRGIIKYRREEERKTEKVRLREI